MSTPAPSSGEMLFALEGVQLTSTTTSQSSSPKPSSVPTSNAAASVAAWTVAEKESLREQMADFPGLHELVRQNVGTLEEARQLIPERGDSSFPSTQAGANFPFCQESFKELESLVNMATVLQNVAVSLAVICNKICRGASLSAAEATCILLRASFFWKHVSVLL